MPNEPAALRALLATISDDELDVFCYDNYRTVYNKFSTGMTKVRKIQNLIEYCERAQDLSGLEKKLRKSFPELFPAAPVVTPQSVQPVPAQPIAGGDSTPGDIYTPYEQALVVLLSRLGQSHAQYGSALVLKQRLTENLSATRLYGDTDSRKADRAVIIAQLNRLALAEFGVSFDELTRTPAPPTMSAEEQAHQEELRNTQRRRLHLLQLQAAQFGLQTPPHITIEIEQLKRQLGIRD